jgi:hypothetical protein
MAGEHCGQGGVDLNRQGRTCGCRGQEMTSDTADGHGAQRGVTLSGERRRRSDTAVDRCGQDGVALHGKRETVYHRAQGRGSDMAVDHDGQDGVALNGWNGFDICGHWQVGGVCQGVSLTLASNQGVGGTCGDGTSVTVVVWSMSPTGSHNSLVMRRRSPLVIWCGEGGDDQQI